MNYKAAIKQEIKVAYVRDGFLFLTVNQRQSGQVTWALLTGLWITQNHLT